MVVEIPDLSRFSEGMKALKKAYAHRYNISHKRFGAVWRDRYKAKIIEDEAYFVGNHVKATKNNNTGSIRKISWFLFTEKI